MGYSYQTQTHFYDGLMFVERERSAVPLADPCCKLIQGEGAYGKKYGKTELVKNKIIS